jgi:hypothetical protein
VQALGAAILKLCIEAGGSISGEHGVGSDKRCYMDWMFNADDQATMLLVRAGLRSRGAGQSRQGVSHAAQLRRIGPPRPGAAGRGRQPACWGDGLLMAWASGTAAKVGRRMLCRGQLRTQTQSVKASTLTTLDQSCPGRSCRLTRKPGSSGIR